MSGKDDKVLIFGKDTCPYTTAAREDYVERGFKVEYIKVLESEKGMKQMVAFSGERNVPVMVEINDKGDTKVSVGFGGT